MCSVAGIRNCCRFEKPHMIELYYAPGSPPCRLVLLVMTALEIPMNRHVVDLKDKDQLKPEFLKINPQHTVPTIVDEGFSLWESRTIARYLVNKYSDTCEMYPLDPTLRAVVDQRLDFDLGTLCPSFSQYFYPQLFNGVPPKESQKKKLDESLKYLEKFLEVDQYVCGPDMTIADLALVVTVSTIDAAGISLQDYPNILRWFDLMKNRTEGYEQYNEKGLTEFKNLIKNVKKMRDERALKSPVAAAANDNNLATPCRPPPPPATTSVAPQTETQPESSKPLKDDEKDQKMLFENSKEHIIHNNPSEALMMASEADVLRQARVKRHQDKT